MSYKEQAEAIYAKARARRAAKEGEAHTGEIKSADVHVYGPYTLARVESALNRTAYGLAELSPRDTDMREVGVQLALTRACRKLAKMSPRGHERDIAMAYRIASAREAVAARKPEPDPRGPAVEIIRARPPTHAEMPFEPGERVRALENWDNGSTPGTGIRAGEIYTVTRADIDRHNACCWLKELPHASGFFTTRFVRA